MFIFATVVLTILCVMLNHDRKIYKQRSIYFEQSHLHDVARLTTINQAQSKTIKRLYNKLHKTGCKQCGNIVDYYVNI